MVGGPERMVGCHQTIFSMNQVFRVSQAASLHLSTVVLHIMYFVFLLILSGALVNHNYMPVGQKVVVLKHDIKYIKYQTIF